MLSAECLCFTRRARCVCRSLSAPRELCNDQRIETIMCIHVCALIGVRGPFIYFVAPVIFKMVQSPRPAVATVFTPHCWFVPLFVWLLLLACFCLCTLFLPETSTYMCARLNVCVCATVLCVDLHGIDACFYIATPVCMYDV